MNNLIAKDLNFNISMCDHWSEILSSYQDGQDTSRPPPNPSHPYGQYFKLCQGNKLRKKLPWAKSATQGLVKSETDLLSICKSCLLFFSIDLFSNSLCIWLAQGCPKTSHKKQSWSEEDLPSHSQLRMRSLIRFWSQNQLGIGNSVQNRKWLRQIH